MIDRRQFFAIDHIALTTGGNIGAIGARFFVTSPSACTIDRDDLSIDSGYRSIDGNVCEIDSNNCLIGRGISHSRGSIGAIDHRVAIIDTSEFEHRLPR